MPDRCSKDGLVPRLFYALFGGSHFNQVNLANLRNVCGFWLTGNSKDLRVINGRVFRHSEFKDEQILRMAGEDGFCWQRFQESHNQVDMLDALECSFFNHSYESDDLEFVADLYEALLSYKVKKDFAQEQFVIKRYEEDDGDITITFYQANDAGLG